jgi:hypothetical protein
MELEAQLNELSKVVREHREVLLTEEAAKNALVMPFLQSLGYNVFNPSEVIPEFTCDVGTKKGEKVDYAICHDDKISILVECKPASSELSINNAHQLFRYFSVTDARIAILTNGVIFKFFADIDNPNKMDDKPFFTLDMDGLKKGDVRTLANFTKGNFNIDTIVAEAGTLKMQSLVAKELEKEFAEPSEEFIRLVANRVHEGRITSSIKESFKSLIVASVNSLIRDKVNERLTSALQASNPMDADDDAPPATLETDGVLTTQDEIDGFNIVRAIGSRAVDPSRIVIRDAKSYCAILLDDNNRKTIARLHFNSPTARYVGTFSGKNEERHSVNGPVDLYKFEKAISARIGELEG